MVTVQVKKDIYESIENVYACWNDDYSNIYKFNPNLKHSYVLDDSPTECGLGATRQCDLKDGKNWMRERVVKAEKNKQIVIEIYEATLPFKNASATLDFKKKNAKQTEVTFTMRFQPKMGILNFIMGPIMKRMFTPGLQAVLDNNAAFIETGKQVNKTVAA